MTAKYDTIGRNYAFLRQTEPRIAAPIHRALGEARSVLNVGAGTGSYEPSDREVTALEASAEMIAKRPATAAPAIQGTAEELPFEDDSFDAAMAVLTIHHWSDQARGLAEMRRVSKGPVVLLTFDPDARPWLTDYLPQLAQLDAQQMPPLSAYRRWLGDVSICEVPVPHDCIDGFLYAYWRRPEAYLDARMRSGSSSFWALEDTADGLARLKSDLESGRWHQTYDELLEKEEYDAGYRLVVAS